MPNVAHGDILKLDIQFGGGYYNSLLCYKTFDSYMSGTNMLLPSTVYFCIVVIVPFIKKRGTGSFGACVVGACVGAVTGVTVAVVAVVAVVNTMKKNDTCIYIFFTYMYERDETSASVPPRG
ncbi:hypothetical protein EDC94DRAFT_579351 [Helicostylum pulchrum]|nr:hypothetical protein EDC94DRAFT_579351 [Helicostylum pulchrum]